MTSHKISTKTMARIAAVQVLYQYKIEDTDKNIDLIMQQIVKYYKDEGPKSSEVRLLNKPMKVRISISHFERLVKNVTSNIIEIDKVISNNLASEWLISSLPLLLLALLRVGVGELQFLQDVPSKVVINEFTDIASEMLDENEVGFVNSILDRISKQDR